MVRSVGAPAERAPAPRHGSRGLALAVLTMVLFLTFLDNTIVSVALGSVQAELHAGVSALQWVVSAYALTFAGAMLAFGMVGDEFGRKRVMLIGVGIFCAGSVLAALAPNIGLVIAGRAVMGFGAAASEPGTLSMLRHLYTEERTRTRAVGVWAAVSGLALALGPVIGGALVGVWNWRAIFWFNLVFGLAALVAGLIVLPENSDPDAHRVDIPGTVLGAARPDRADLRGDRRENAGFTSPSVLTPAGPERGGARWRSSGGRAGPRIRCWTCGSCGCRGSSPPTWSRSAPTSRRSPSSSSPRCTSTRWSATPATRSRWSSCR